MSSASIKTRFISCFPQNYGKMLSRNVLGNRGFKLLWKHTQTHPGVCFYGDSKFN